MTGQQDTQLVHANCICIDNKGLLILGDSGAGKSTIALALMERAQWSQRHAYLVADDYCEIKKGLNGLLASAPANIQGGIEVFGAGLYSLPSQANILLSHCVHLGETFERYPSGQTYDCFGYSLPMLALGRLGIFDGLVLCQAIEAFLFGKRWEKGQ